MILQDARARRSLIPFLLLQPISRTREQSPPLGDIPSSLGEQGQKNGRQRDTMACMYTNVCIHIHLHQLFPSFPARFVLRRKIYTQNSPESSFGRRRSNLTPFYLTCILQNSLISDTSLSSRASERPFFARQQFRSARAVSTWWRARWARRPSCPRRRSTNAGHVALSFSFLFASYFAARCANASPPPPPSSVNKPHLGKRITHTHSPTPHSSRFTSCRQGILAHSLGAGSARADRDLAEMLLGDLHPPQGRHVQQLPLPHAFPP